MKWYGNLTLIILFAGLAGVVYVGINSAEIYEVTPSDELNESEILDVIQRLETIIETLEYTTTEDEFNEMLDKMLTDSAVLKSCAILYKELENPPMVDITLEKNREELQAFVDMGKMFNDLYCQISIEQWIK